MRILALDLATKAGFAMGRAGEKPRAWSKRLRTSEDAPERAFKRLGIELRDLFTLELPDLVVVEAPLAGGLIGNSNMATVYQLNGLVGGVFTICGPYGIRCIKANVQTVRKHVVGRARPDNPKKAVLDRCKALGYLPPECFDDNIADAVAMHIWASDTEGRPALRGVAQ